MKIIVPYAGVFIEEIIIKPIVRECLLLSTIVLNSRDQQGMYGFPPLKNNHTIAFASNAGHM